MSEKTMRGWETNPVTTARWPGRLKSRPWKETAGFTLLELLVSITIVSLLATTILFGWRVASSAWRKASSRLEQHRTVLATHLLLQEQMASMVPYPAWPRTGIPEFFFQGEPQVARFLSRYSLTNRARSGLYLVEYQIAERTDGTKHLLLNESPVSGPEDLGALIIGADTDPAGRILRFVPWERAAQTVALLEGLEECRFEYYRPAFLSQPGVWTPQWRNFNDELPRAIAIRAVAASVAGEVRPVSIVAAVQDFSRRRD